MAIIVPCDKKSKGFEKVFWIITKINFYAHYFGKNLYKLYFYAVLMKFYK